jgi:osmotically-inducible protein OsmY
MSLHSQRARIAPWTAPRVGPAAVVAAGLLLAFVSLSSAENEPAGTLTSRSISDAVEDTYRLDPAVPFDRIDVTTEDGIVTLIGTVSNILAKDRAAQLAESVRGVRAVVNQIVVEPLAHRSDAAIRADIRIALAEDPATESYEVDVAVDGGVATLTGTVDSWQEQQLAIQVAKGVRGVTEVLDGIDVDYDHTRADQEIRQEILRTLRWDTLVDDALIDVAVENGRVTLSGTVGSAAEKERARLDAWTSGVQRVTVEDLDVHRWARDSDLKVDKYASTTDAEIREAVADAMLHDPRVLSFEIEPQVGAGIVTLRGTVDNLKAKRAAVMDARNTVGVVDVEDRIKVRSEVAISDGEIERAIAQALLRNPYLSHREIAVDVASGNVYLTGDVDTYFEKAQAEDVVSRILGVTKVHNDLEVHDLAHTPGFDPYIDDYHLWGYDWYDQRALSTLESDAAIQDSIESELWWSPFVDADEVQVVVEEGVATLTGVVDSWSEFRAATNNAYEGGAVRVDNELVVDPQS